MPKKRNLFNKWDVLVVIGITCMSFLTVGLVHVRDVVGPLLMLPQSLTFDRNFLDQCGPSTNSSRDLLVSQEMSLEEGVKVLDKHGGAIVPSILSRETSRLLRQYVLSHNNIIGHSFVLEPTMRTGLLLGADVPIIQQAFSELSEHPTLRPLLDAVLGPHSALTGFSARTALFGARGEAWHTNSPYSHAALPHLFAKELNLVVYLQNTPPDMAASIICPGTHQCAKPALDYEALEQQYEESAEFTADFATFEDYLGRHLPCAVAGEVSAGDGYLLNTDALHREGGHRASDQGDQVSLVFSFAQSRKEETGGAAGGEQRAARSLPLGTAHMLRWDLWGHSLDELGTAEDTPWRLWRALGLSRPLPHADGSTSAPYTLWDEVALVFTGAARGQACQVLLVADFTAEVFAAGVSRMVWLTCFGAVGYAATKILQAGQRMYRASLRARKIK